VLESGGVVNIIIRSGVYNFFESRGTPSEKF